MWEVKQWKQNQLSLQKSREKKSHFFTSKNSLWNLFYKLFRFQSVFFSSGRLLHKRYRLVPSFWLRYCFASSVFFGIQSLFLKLFVFAIFMLPLILSGMESLFLFFWLFDFFAFSVSRRERCCIGKTYSTVKSNCIFIINEIYMLKHVTSLVHCS